MTFNLSNTLSKSLIDGYHNGSFTAEQVVVFAGNYLAKAMITQEDFEEVLAIFIEEEEG